MAGIWPPPAVLAEVTGVAPEGPAAVPVVRGACPGEWRNREGGALEVAVPPQLRPEQSQGGRV